MICLCVYQLLTSKNLPIIQLYGLPITLSIISNIICKTVQTKPPFGFYEIKRMVPNTKKTRHLSFISDPMFLVLPKISYSLPVYASSVPELYTVQQFLRRCHKRRFISYTIDVYHFLQKTNKSISKKISCLPTYPPYNLLPRVKKSSKRLRTHTSLLPCVNTELFKASYINRLYFKYTFTF